MGCRQSTINSFSCVVVVAGLILIHVYLLTCEPICCATLAARCRKCCLQLQLHATVSALARVKRAVSRLETLARDVESHNRWFICSAHGYRVILTRQQRHWSALCLVVLFVAVTPCSVALSIKPSIFVDSCFAIVHKPGNICCCLARVVCTLFLYSTPMKFHWSGLVHSSTILA